MFKIPPCLPFSLFHHLATRHAADDGSHVTIARGHVTTLLSSTRKLSRLSSVNFPTSNMVTAWFFRLCITGERGGEITVEFTRRT